MTTTGIVNMEVVKKEVEMDEDLKQIIEELKTKPDETSKYQWDNGSLTIQKESSTVQNFFIDSHPPTYVS